MFPFFFQAAFITFIIMQIVKMMEPRKENVRDKETFKFEEI